MANSMANDAPIDNAGAVRALADLLGASVQTARQGIQDFVAGLGEARFRSLGAQFDGYRGAGFSLDDSMHRVFDSISKTMTFGMMQSVLIPILGGLVAGAILLALEASVIVAAIGTIVVFLVLLWRSAPTDWTDRVGVQLRRLMSDF